MLFALNGLILLGGLFLAAFFFNLALRLGRVDALEAEKSASRVNRNFKEALFGRARTVDDWLPDARIKAGLIYNQDKNRLEPSGRLSNDAFGRVFRPRT